MSTITKADMNLIFPAGLAKQVNMSDLQMMLNSLYDLGYLTPQAGWTPGVNEVIAGDFISVDSNNPSKPIVSNTMIASDLDAVTSDISAVAGSEQIVNIIKVTQAQYDALTPDANTFYVIVG